MSAHLAVLASALPVSDGQASEVPWSSRFRRRGCRVVVVVVGFCFSRLLSHDSVIVVVLVCRSLARVVLAKAFHHFSTHKVESAERFRNLECFQSFPDCLYKILRFANHLSFFVSEAASGILKLELDLQKSDSPFTRS